MSEDGVCLSKPIEKLKKEHVCGGADCAICNEIIPALEKENRTVYRRSEAALTISLFVTHSKCCPVSPGVENICMDKSVDVILLCGNCHEALHEAKWTEKLSLKERLKE